MIGQFPNPRKSVSTSLSLSLSTLWCLLSISLSLVWSLSLSCLPSISLPLLCLIFSSSVVSLSLSLLCFILILVALLSWVLASCLILSLYLCPFTVSLPIPLSFLISPPPLDRHSLSLSIYLSLHPSIYLSTSLGLSIYLSLSLCLSVHPLYLSLSSFLLWTGSFMLGSLGNMGRLPGKEAAGRGIAGSGMARPAASRSSSPLTFSFQEACTPRLTHVRSRDYPSHLPSSSSHYHPCIGISLSPLFLSSSTVASYSFPPREAGSICVALCFLLSLSLSFFLSPTLSIRYLFFFSITLKSLAVM